jgi:hypothetical protein
MEPSLPMAHGSWRIPFLIPYPSSPGPISATQVSLRQAYRLRTAESLPFRPKGLAFRSSELDIPMCGRVFAVPRAWSCVAEECST